MATNREGGLWKRQLCGGLTGLGGESLADELPEWFGAKRAGETLGCRNRAPKCWPGDPIASVLGRGVASLLLHIIIPIELYDIKLNLLIHIT